MAQEPDRGALDPATRARLEAERAEGNRGSPYVAVKRDDLSELLRCYDALLTEQAQAAPVLAAAERWYETPEENDVDDVNALWEAVAVWRAAREE